MKKTKITKVAIAGFALFQFGLWGGAVGMHYLPQWLGFPAFATASIAGIAGLLMLIGSALRNIDQL